MTVLIQFGGLPTTQRTLDRFLSKVDTSGGPDACWPWKNKLKDDGYGAFHMSKGDTFCPNRAVRAHRAAYALIVGVIPADCVIDHTCHDPAVCRVGDDCPHRACVNPRHLAAVSPAANTARSSMMIPAAPAPAEMTPRRIREVKPTLVRARETRRASVGALGHVEMSFELRWPPRGRVHHVRLQVS